MNFVDQNTIQTFEDENGVTLFIDQNGVLLGLEVSIVRKVYVAITI